MIKSMLTDPAQPSNQPQTPPQPIGSTGLGKEVDSTVTIGETIKDISPREIELPKEVASAGVKVHPTTVTVPPKVSQYGVKPIGPNQPVAPTATVQLPLTDDQIAQGLKASITSSWRWLAEWCVRKLKQLHRKIVKSS